MALPREEDTFVGPMISEGEARRLHGWVLEAAAAGATILCGGGREGAMLEPTLVEGCPDDALLYTEEAFGPAVTIEPFDDFDAALERVNHSKFGLQAGVFTRDLYRAQRAYDELEVGGVVIGDVPSWRVDNMPYGGVKDSGLGREGVRFAIEDMSEIRMLVIR
jgi:acyl-CoA reductase-like NAD-dependent aldehyde dehydrogenase